MHVRNDFRLWYHEPKDRIKTLCGKKTTRKFVGIPMIDRMQPAAISRDGKDFGWCLKCSEEALRIMTEVVKGRVDEVLYEDFYRPAMKIMVQQLELVGVPLTMVPECHTI